MQTELRECRFYNVHAVHMLHKVLATQQLVGPSFAGVLCAILDVLTLFLTNIFFFFIDAIMMLFNSLGYLQ